MKTKLETFEDVQKVSRFVCNGSIPFAYSIDFSEMGTPLSGTHIVRIIEKSTGSVIVVKLSENEAAVILKSDDPIDYLRRWLGAFRQKHGGEELLMKPETIIRGVAHKPVFDEKYFIVGKAYHLTIKNLKDNYVYNDTVHDVLIKQYNCFKNVMTVMFVNDDNEYVLLDLTIEQFIAGRFKMTQL